MDSIRDSAQMVLQMGDSEATAQKVLENIILERRENTYMVVCAAVNKSGSNREISREVLLSQVVSNFIELAVLATQRPEFDRIESLQALLGRLRANDPTWSRVSPERFVLDFIRPEIAAGTCYILADGDRILHDGVHLLQGVNERFALY